MGLLLRRVGVKHGAPCSQVDQYSLVTVNTSDSDQTIPFWFPIAGHYREELHGGALDLSGILACLTRGVAHGLFELRTGMDGELIRNVEGGTEPRAIGPGFDVFPHP